MVCAALKVFRCISLLVSKSYLPPVSSTSFLIVPTEGGTIVPTLFGPVGGPLCSRMRESWLPSEFDSGYFRILQSEGHVEQFSGFQIRVATGMWLSFACRGVWNKCVWERWVGLQREGRWGSGVLACAYVCMRAGVYSRLAGLGRSRGLWGLRVKDAGVSGKVRWFTEKPLYYLTCDNECVLFMWLKIYRDGKTPLPIFLSPSPSFSTPTHNFHPSLSLSHTHQVRDTTPREALRPLHHNRRPE